MSLQCRLKVRDTGSQRVLIEYLRSRVDIFLKRARRARKRQVPRNADRLAVPPPLRLQL